MKKIITLLMIIILIPVFVVGGALTFLKFADLNKYKPQIEDLARKYAHIEVKINGDIDVGVAIKPTIELSDVLVSDINSKAKIARIGNALVQFSVMPLLHKEVVIDTVQTDNTEIFYGKNDSLLINDLDLSMESYDAPINIAFDTTVSGIDIFGKAVVSSFKKLTGSKFNDIDINTTVNAMGYKLDFDGNVKNATEKLAAAGKYNLKYKNTAINGNVSADMSGSLPYVKLNASSDVINVADFTATKRADNSWLIGSAYATTSGTVKIPYEFLGMANADVDFDFKKIKIEPNITVNNVKGKVYLHDRVLKADINNIEYDGNKITGFMEIKDKNLPYIKLKVNGAGFDLTKFTSQKKADASWLIGNAYASQLMANTVIPYEYLRMANADVSVNVNKITVNKDISFADVVVNAALNGGILNTKIQNITAGEGKISGNISLNANSKTLSTDLVGNNIVLQKLYKPIADANNMELYVKSGGVATINIKVNTSGSNTDQYLANLNGQIIAFVDPSVLRIKSLDKLQSNIIVQILKAININVTNGDLDMSCAVVRTDISNGLAKFPNGIVFDSKSFYLVSNGKLDLKTDKINFDLQPFSGKITDVNISSVLGNLLKITGTINNPKIGINQTSTAKNIVGILATGGVYNAGDILMSPDSSPCHTSLKGTAYVSHFKEVVSVRNTVSKGYNNTKESIKDMGKGLKHQAKEIESQAKEIGNQLKGLFK